MPRPLFPDEDWKYVLTMRLCGPQSQCGNFGEERNIPLYLNSNSGIIQLRASTVFRRRRFSLRNLKLRKLVTYGQKIVTIIPAVLYNLPCQFSTLYILFLYGRM